MPMSVTLDHLPDQQSGLLLQSGPPRPARAHRVAEDPDEGRDVAGQAIDADQDHPAQGAGPDHRHQTRDQDQTRRGLITPPSHSRAGAAMAIAIQTRRPTILTDNSLAWTCWRSTCPR
jgi:hypothetical protein